MIPIASVSTIYIYGDKSVASVIRGVERAVGGFDDCAGTGDDWIAGIGRAGALGAALLGVVCHGIVRVSGVVLPNVLACFCGR